MKAQKGFAALEVVLILAIVALLGGVGWYVYQSKNNANSAYNNSSQANSNTPNYSSIKTFDDCKKAVGSKVQESFPAVCVTKDGKRFVQSRSSKFIIVKEWGVKFSILPDTPSAVYYKLVNNSGRVYWQPSDELDFYAPAKDHLSDICKKEESVATYVVRRNSALTTESSKPIVINGKYYYVRGGNNGPQTGTCASNDSDAHQQWTIDNELYELAKTLQAS